MSNEDDGNGEDDEGVYSAATAEVESVEVKAKETAAEAMASVFALVYAFTRVSARRLPFAAARHAACLSWTRHSSLTFSLDSPASCPSHRHRTRHDGHD